MCEGAFLEKKPLGEYGFVLQQVESRCSAGRGCDYAKYGVAMKSLRSASLSLVVSLFLLCMALTMPAHAQTITMGQTTILSTGNSGNANKLDALSATLSENATNARKIEPE